MVLAFAMMLSLGQFQETPQADWVKLAEQITAEFNLDHTSVRVALRERPTQLRVTYLTRQDSKFNLAVQNAEMEKIASYAMQNYKGRDLHLVEQITVNRSETHGSG